MIVLTPEGEQTFEAVFPKHTAYLKERFGCLSQQELEEIRLALKKLREIF
jgi:DNA-binding MarR family transcriptional regulator